MDNILIYGKDVNTNTITPLQAYSNTLLITGMPVGSITQYAGSSAPSGWLLCNGSAISRTTYSALFSVISTTYGIGDNSTTFGIPDLRTRIPVGLNATGTFTSLGATGGSDTTALTLLTANIPSHSHFIFTRAQFTGTNTTLTNTQYVHDITTFGGSGTNPYNYAMQGNATAASVGLTSSTGSGSSFNAMPSYIVINYIIFTGV
jgi:microcystin-dependent protein